MKLCKTVLKVAQIIALNIPCAVDTKLTCEDILDVAGVIGSTATRTATTFPCTTTLFPALFTHSVY